MCVDVGNNRDTIRSPLHCSLTHVAADHSVEELQEEGSEEATHKDNQRSNGDTCL